MRLLLAACRSHREGQLQRYEDLMSNTHDVSDIQMRIVARRALAGNFGSKDLAAASKIASRHVHALQAPCLCTYFRTYYICTFVI